MKTNLYADTVADSPILSIEPETLSDGSQVFNLNWCGNTIPCISQRHAQSAFVAIYDALKMCTNENIAIDAWSGAGQLAKGGLTPKAYEPNKRIPRRQRLC